MWEFGFNLGSFIASCVGLGGFQMKNNLKEIGKKGDAGSPARERERLRHDDMEKEVENSLTSK